MSENNSGLTKGAIHAPVLHKRDSFYAPDTTTTTTTNSTDTLTERDVRSAFLEDILTKEQNTCIEIRDICTGISNDAKEALRSGCSREFIRTLKEQMQTLQAGIELLDDTTSKKTMLEEDFVEKGTMDWLAKRFSSETRRRRLRGHKRRPKQDSDDFELPRKADGSPIQGTPASSPSSSFELYPPYVKKSPKPSPLIPPTMSKSVPSSPLLAPISPFQTPNSPFQTPNSPFQPPNSPMIPATHPIMPFHPSSALLPPATPNSLATTQQQPQQSARFPSKQMKISNIIN